MNTLDSDWDIKTYAKKHPYSYRFKDLDWLVFGTLTFKDSRRRYRIEDELARREAFRCLMYRGCKEFKIRPKYLASYCALEWKEHCHYHFLIAKNRAIEHVLSIDEFAASLQSLWQSELKPFEGDSLGIGRADIRPYNQAMGLAGVDYCLKREFDDSGKEMERIDYVSPALIGLSCNVPMNAELKH